MRNFKWNQELAILSLISLVAVSVCSKNLDVKPDNRLNDAGENLAPARLCPMTDTLFNVTPEILGKFFGKIVRNLEGPVTFCLDLDNSGSELSGTFRIEYEDDFGIRYYTSDDGDIFDSKFTQEGEDVSLEIIFIDSAGFVQVKGTSVGSSPMEAQIRFHNFPSYEEGLQTAVAEVQAKCKDGRLTVAQCMGYNFPSTFWWNQPVYTSYHQYVLSLAKELLSNPTKSHALGDIRFELSDVLKQ